ncbi:MAG TPA: PAS domain S-box protein, partial [Ilumatobacteraceae bacterium]|nr:PAS domain S-box protein [Ilumatobacteraceae bacterium]
MQPGTTGTGTVAARDARALRDAATQVGDGAPEWVPSWGRAMRLLAIGGGLSVFMVAAGWVVGARGADDWAVWTNLMLAVLCSLCAFAGFDRSRGMREPTARFAAVAFGGAAFAHLARALAASSIAIDEPLHVVSAMGELVWFAGLGLFLVRRLDRLPRGARFVHLVDAAMLTAAVSFIVWETTVLPALGDPTTVGLETQAAAIVFPALDVFLAVMVLLSMSFARSASRAFVATGLILLAGAENARHATAHFPTASTLTVDAVFSMLGLLALMAALGLPVGGGIVERRPSLPRLVIVSGFMATAVWVATASYVIGDTPTTVVTIVLGIGAGALWTTSRVADYVQATSWADRLQVNIEELERTKDELRALLDDLPEAVVVLDQDGRIAEANANVLRLTGRVRDDLLGRPFVELFTAEQLPELMGLWARLRDGEQLPPTTLRFDRPDGSSVLLEGSVNMPLSDRNRVVVALRDVTERTAEARRLERARERFRLAFHNAPTGMALSTAGDRRLVDVNDSLAEILGRSRDELLRLAVDDITHPDDRAQHVALLERAA